MRIYFVGLTHPVRQKKATRQRSLESIHTHCFGTVEQGSQDFLNVPRQLAGIPEDSPCSTSSQMYVGTSRGL